MPLRSPLEPLPVPEVAIHRHFFQHFKQHLDNVALVDNVTGEEWTYRDVLRLSRAVASGLVKLGVKKGDVFAVYSFNSPQLVIMMWAVMATGATLTSVNPAHTKYELRHQLADASVKFIYTSNDKIPTVLEAATDIFPLKNVVVDVEHGQMNSFEQLSKDDCSEWRGLEMMEFVPKEDAVIILYSSGTTGTPKGVPHTHYSVLYSSIQRRHPGMRGPLKAVNTLVVTPLHHAYPFTAFMCTEMAYGSKVVIHKTFDVENLLRAVEAHKVSILYLVSSSAVKLAKSHLLKHYDLSSLQHIYSGGATLSKDILQIYNSNMGITTKQVYGMTEASFISFDHYNEKPKHGSVGVLLPGLEGQVIDLKNGNQLGPDQMGELCIRGPQIMKQYLNSPQKTREAFDESGWLHTGDVGYYDKDNYIYVIDRIKDIFKVLDYQVSPSELEGVLFTHPAVLEAAVVGLPDEMVLNKPKAFVVQKPGMQVSEQELCDYVADKCADYKRLTGGVEFIPEIPKLPSGKIIRRQLQEMALASVKKQDA